METRNPTQISHAVVEHMKEEKEASIFTTFFKSNYPSVDTSDGLGLTQPPIYTPIYIKDEAQFIFKVDGRPLRQAVKAYLMENPDCGFWRQGHSNDWSWSHVVEEIEKTKQVYRGKAKNNFVRRLARDHTNNVTTHLESLSLLVPQEYGGGLLQLAFKIIFQAVRRRSETCERIFSALEGIPQMIVRVEGYNATYHSQIYFQECYGRLHTALAECIPRLIDVLLRRGSQSGLKQRCKELVVDGVAKVEEILKPLREAETKLIQCQGHLQANDSAQAKTHARSTDSKLDVILKKLDAIETSAGNGSPEFQALCVQLLCEMEKQNREFREQMQGEKEYRERELLERERWAREQVLLQHSQHVENAQAVLKNVQQSVMDLVYREVSYHLSRSQNTKVARPAQMRLTISHVPMICTEDEKEAAIQDFQAVRQAHNNFDNTALSRAYYLIATPRFLGWLMEPNSDIILVDGHCQDQNRGHISPLSTFCAGLIRTLSSSENMREDISKLIPHQPEVILYYFCGEHTMLGESLEGPHGMMRSLIAQLIDQWPYDEPPEVSSPFYRADVFDPDTWQEANIKSLCRIFHQILTQLGSAYPVYCVIDGLSYFETDMWGWGSDLAIVVGWLLDYIRTQQEELSDTDEKGLAPLKVMLVSPERSTDVCNEFSESDQISLRAGNSGELSSMLWSR